MKFLHFWMIGATLLGSAAAHVSSAAEKTVLGPASRPLKIVLITATWCTYCRQVKEEMGKSGPLHDLLASFPNLTVEQVTIQRYVTEHFTKNSKFFDPETGLTKKKLSNEPPNEEYPFKYVPAIYLAEADGTPLTYTHAATDPKVGAWLEYEIKKNSRPGSLSHYPNRFKILRPNSISKVIPKAKMLSKTALLKDTGASTAAPAPTSLTPTNQASTASTPTVKAMETEIRAQLHPHAEVPAPAPHALVATPPSLAPTTSVPIAAATGPSVLSGPPSCALMKDNRFMAPVFSDPKLKCASNILALQALAGIDPGCVKFEKGKEQGFINLSPPFFAVKASDPVKKTLGVCEISNDHHYFQTYSDPSKYPWGKDQAGIEIPNPAGKGVLYCRYKDFHAETKHHGADLEILRSYGDAAKTGDYRYFNCTTQPDSKIRYSRLFPGTLADSNQGKGDRICKPWLENALTNRSESALAALPPSLTDAQKTQLGLTQTSCAKDYPQIAKNAGNRLKEVPRSATTGVTASPAIISTMSDPAGTPAADSGQ